MNAEPTTGAFTVSSKGGSKVVKKYANLKAEIREELKEDPSGKHLMRVAKVAKQAAPKGKLTASAADRIRRKAGM